MPQRLTANALIRFGKDERGAIITLEFLLFLPVLVFVLVGGYFFFDAYRERALVQKAAFTLADLISRETDSLGDTYFDSMFALQGHITNDSTPVAMRASVVRWDEPDGETGAFTVTDSITRGSGLTSLTDEDVVNFDQILPDLTNGESLVLVTIRHEYTITDFLNDQTVTFEDFVFTAPRFAPTVRFYDPT